jgi:S1-C subfamily serine protease
MSRALRLSVLLASAIGLFTLADVSPAPGQGRTGPFSSFADHVGDLVGETRAYLVRVERPASLPSGEQTRMLGSGLSVGDGFVLTAATVTGPAESLTVVLPDEQRIPGRVVGVDRRTNVAVLQIPRTDLPIAPVARIPLLFPGALVVAVGFGPEDGPDASYGNVILVEGPNLLFTGADMVEVTAPAFAGMTGGGLFNREGEVVGLISGWMEIEARKAIAPPGTDLVAGFVRDHSLRSTTLQSATLAVPVLRALRVAEEIIEKGFVERGYLGLQLELTRADADPSRRLRGVMVHGVVAEGPAAAAGLIPGDVILEYSKAKVTSPADLFHLVSASIPGSTVPVRFLRKGRYDLTMVRIKQAPELEWVQGMDAQISASSIETGLARNER